MKILDHGHRYELSCLNGDYTQQLVFAKREGTGYPGNVGSYSGTVCQEVLRALIERCQYLNGQIPCWHNVAIIWLLTIALWLFELRHAQRNGRFWISPVGILQKEPCPKCQHVDCGNH